MINPTSKNTEIHIPQIPAAATQTVEKPAPTRQDSVHLSPQAQAAASGDIDHDGDSH